MSARKGTPREIATQGMSSAEGLGIATQGFIEPILGDIIFGGRALVDFRPVNLIIGGAGSCRTIYNIGLTDGGLIIDGSGNIVLRPVIIGDGGLIIGGAADVAVDVNETFGRGGARSPRRVPRLPNTQFELPQYNLDDFLEPMDYLKKIQDALNKERLAKLNLFHHLSKGTIEINGKGHVVAILRDQPDGDIVFANNLPLEPIVLELDSLFIDNNTAIEMAELEDHLFLNDLFGLGNYQVRKGNKARYIPQRKKSTSGAASVSFVSGGGSVRHVNAKRRRQQREDDELVLGIKRQRNQRRIDQDDEELRLLGFID